MNVLGNVMLAGDVIGSFEFTEDEKIVMGLDKEYGGVEEALEFASEQGFGLTLMLKPEYEEEASN